MNLRAFTALLVLLFACALDVASRAQEEPHYYLQGTGQVVLPGTALVHRFATYSSDPKSRTQTISLYRLPAAVRAEWLQRNRYMLVAKDLQGLQLVRSVTATATQRAGGLYEGEENFGTQPVGQYVAIDQGSGYSSAYIYDVGTLGTVWHTASGTLLVYAVDLRTMRHRDDVRYTVLQSGTRRPLVSMNGL